MATVATGLSVEQWAKRLNEQWQKTVDGAVRGFIELGRSLIEAKAQILHGEWLQVLSRLNFPQSTAHKFMRITRWVDQNVLNEQNFVEKLPPDYNTIDQLARLKKSQFKQLVEDGALCPALRRNEVAEIIRLDKVKEDETRVLSLKPRPGKFRTIVVDPPWDFDAFSRGAVSKMPYAKQSIEDLMALDLKQWAEAECHLYCWAPNAYVVLAGKLVEHWGFKYKNLLTWVKPPPFGLGKNFRNATEKCLFATLGDRTTRADNIPDYFQAPRGEHSEKPDEFYDIVKAASYPPYGEMHQRKLREGFTDLYMAGDLIEAAE
jgi:N6-adenosine-specific RNA methylase IME4